MKFVLLMLIVGLSMIVYGINFMEPSTVDVMTNRAEVTVLGMLITFLAMAGTLGGGK